MKTHTAATYEMTPAEVLTVRALTVIELGIALGTIDYVAVDLFSEGEI